MLPRSALILGPAQDKQTQTLPAGATTPSLELLGKEHLGGRHQTGSLNSFPGPLQSPATELQPRLSRHLAIQHSQWPVRRCLWLQGDGITTVSDMEAQGSRGPGTGRGAFPGLAPSLCRGSPRSGYRALHVVWQEASKRPLDLITSATHATASIGEVRHGPELSQSVTCG